MSSPNEISKTLVEAYSDSLPANKIRGLSFSTKSVVEGVMQPLG